jgi:hypothetical protein
VLGFVPQPNLQNYKTPIFYGLCWVSFLNPTYKAPIFYSLI